MAEILEFPERRRLFADLSPEEREFAENLLRIAPNYRYEVSGMPSSIRRRRLVRQLRLRR